MPRTGCLRGAAWTGRALTAAGSGEEVTPASYGALQSQVRELHRSKSETVSGRFGGYLTFEPLQFSAQRLVTLQVTCKLIMVYRP